MLKTDPWLGAVTPGRIFGNLYFVGTVPASTHLIDTGEGLILIDPAHEESLYLVLDSIWRLGFDPKDIRYILITHAHHDHSDATEALKALCGATVCLSRADKPLLDGEIYHYPLRPFTPDLFLEDGDEIVLGNTRIKCLLTPGHTDGTMSFFFDVTDGKRTLRAGMHGGTGTNTLVREFLEKNHLPFDCREKFLCGLERAAAEKVDITLGNHAHQNNTVEKLKRVAAGETDAFVDPEEWPRFLASRRHLLEKILSKEKE